MRFASRSLHALVLAFAPSLLGAAFILQCTSDGARSTSVADGGLPGTDAAIIMVHEGTHGDGPVVVRADEPRAPAVDDDLQLAVDANNAFALDLYRQATTPGINFVTSPQVWGETTYTWQTPFLGVLARDYGTGIYAWDFSKDPTGGEDAINAWVSDETGGAVSPLLPADALGTLTRFVLVNALHVKVPWASPFNPGDTGAGTFTRGDGTTVQTPFMFQEFGYAADYLETADARYVGVPLANGMTVAFALPKRDLPSLLASVTSDSFSVPAVPDDVGLDLYLPRFSFETDPFSLASSLKALGMTDAFESPAGSFTGLCASPPDGLGIFLLDVFQRATLDVEEGGIEAAAATAVVGGDDSTVESGDGGMPTVITVRLDRPFLVAVVDASGAILFLGQVTDPTAGG